jgi:hypothetical protein
VLPLGLLHSKTFAALMEEEAAVASTDNERLLMMLSCLMSLDARDGAKPHQGGSESRRCKSKPRQRLEGYYIVYTTDYFIDDPLHSEVVFRRISE